MRLAGSLMDLGIAILFAFLITTVLSVKVNSHPWLDCLDPVIDTSDLKVAPREQTQYHIQPKLTLKYSNLIGGVRKGVKITLENCKAYEVATSVRKGDLMVDMFNPLFQDINRIYVAHEVSFFKLKMQLNNLLFDPLFLILLPNIKIGKPLPLV